MDSHRRWLDALPIRQRLVYDRAFGHQWHKGGANVRACRNAGNDAVMKYQREKTRDA